jgi:hypothetical protein
MTCKGGRVSVSDVGVCVQVFKGEDLGCRVRGSGFRVQGSGFGDLRDDRAKFSL